MANQHGDFIWYELLTSDPGAAQAFYGPMLGWSFVNAGHDVGMDYFICSTAESAVGGLAQVPAGAPMPPAWLGYIGVDDVDRMIESITHAGGKVHMPPMDIPNVGRIALVTDPQGAVFYVMRGASDEDSQSFSYDRPRPGHCAWNELSTTDPADALHFYGQRFGWVKDGDLDMGEMGKYEFLRHAGRGEPGTGAGMLGAVMPKMPQMPVCAWTFYFRVPDIDVAVEHITSNGGTMLVEPMEIPGGEFSINALDPQGASFGLVGARKA